MRAIWGCGGLAAFLPLIDLYGLIQRLNAPDVASFEAGDRIGAFLGELVRPATATAQVNLALILRPGDVV